MKTLVTVCLAATLCLYCAEGQDAPQNPPQNPGGAPSSSSSSSSSAPAGPSERRISGGATLTFLGLQMIGSGTTTVNNTSQISTQYQTKGASERLAYGLTLQGRITEHFYVNVSALLQHIGYQVTTTVATTTTQVLNGTSFPVTTTTSSHEDTRARMIDIPLLIRYYGTPKRPRSPRWFIEAGGAWRTANNIRTSIDMTDVNGNLTCCTFTPAVPQHRSTVGEAVGVGIQFTDEFGIKLTPEVRYTRWINEIFDFQSTRTSRNQLEAGISLTF